MKNINILKWVLILSIIIVLNLFFNFAIKLVYDSPKFEDFCLQKQVTIQPRSEKECISQGGAWTEMGYPIFRGEPTTVKAKLPTSVPPAGGEITGTCDLYFTCQKEFTAVSSFYNRNIFIALVILGLFSVIGGFLMTRYSAVSLGLSFGGVLSFIIGTVRYWSDMDDYLRVIILGFALAVLIWLGVKKIRDIDGNLRPQKN